MTSQKSREFTLYFQTGYFIEGVAIDSKNTMHVIEYSAFEKLQEENFRLNLNVSNNKHIMDTLRNASDYSEQQVRERDHTIMNLDIELRDIKEKYEKAIAALKIAAKNEREHFHAEVCSRLDSCVCNITYLQQKLIELGEVV